MSRTEVNSLVVGGSALFFAGAWMGVVAADSGQLEASEVTAAALQREPAADPRATGSAVESGDQAPSPTISVIVPPIQLAPLAPLVVPGLDGAALIGGAAPRGVTQAPQLVPAPPPVQPVSVAPAVAAAPAAPARPSPPPPVAKKTRAS
jgi:hypothetical protein